MILQSKVDDLAALGLFLKDWADALSHQSLPSDQSFMHKALQAAHAAQLKNAWFDVGNLQLALYSWAEALKKEAIEQWIAAYANKAPAEPKRIGLVLAGNIPLVGLHDVLCVLLYGHVAQIKLSSDDSFLLPIILEFLGNRNDDWKKSYEVSAGILKDADAFIATGSNNSSRYFEFYFGKKPSVIRKNRSSVAILNGKESKDELIALGKDIFSFYGLGCRNVSKLLVPEGYSFNNFFEAIVDYGYVINNNKYGNNYDYHRAIYLLDAVPMLDNNFLLLKPDNGWSSPIGVLFQEAYRDQDDLLSKLATADGRLQCIIGHPVSPLKTIPFGQAQHPALTDYADGIDTLAFLHSL
jgi:hypothetical protein